MRAWTQALSLSCPAVDAIALPVIAQDFHHPPLELRNARISTYHVSVVACSSERGRSRATLKHWHTCHGVASSCGLGFKLCIGSKHFGWQTTGGTVSSPALSQFALYPLTPSGAPACRGHQADTGCRSSFWRLTLQTACLRYVPSAAGFFVAEGDSPGRRYRWSTPECSLTSSAAPEEATSCFTEQMLSP